MKKFYCSNLKFHSEANSMYLLRKFQKINFFVEDIKNKYDFSDEDINKIQKAYILMLNIFSNKYRGNKDISIPYFEHIEGVFKILLNYKNIKAYMFIVALLHDSIEDVEFIDKKYLQQNFDEQIAKNVEILTKRQYKNKIGVNQFNYQFVNKIFHYNDYFENMKNRNQDNIVVKLADRLDNLNDIRYIDSSKIAKKILETEKYFAFLENNENEIINDLRSKIKKRIFILRLNKDINSNYNRLRFLAKKSYSEVDLLKNKISIY